MWKSDPTAKSMKGMIVDFQSAATFSNEINFPQTLLGLKRINPDWVELAAR